MPGQADQTMLLTRVLMANVRSTIPYRHRRTMGCLCGYVAGCLAADGHRSCGWDSEVLLVTQMHPGLVANLDGGIEVGEERRGALDDRVLGLEREVGVVEVKDVVVDDDGGRRTPLKDVPQARLTSLLSTAATNRSRRVAEGGCEQVLMAAARAGGSAR